MEMKQFTGTKTVKACPMTLGEAEKVLNRHIDISSVENRDLTPGRHRTFSSVPTVPAKPSSIGCSSRRKNCPADTSEAASSLSLRSSRNCPTSSSSFFVSSSTPWSSISTSSTSE